MLTAGPNDGILRLVNERIIRSTNKLHFLLLTITVFSVTSTEHSVPHFSGGDPEETVKSLLGRYTFLTSVGLSGSFGVRFFDRRMT